MSSTTKLAMRMTLAPELNDVLEKYQRAHRALGRKYISKADALLALCSACSGSFEKVISKMEQECTDTILRHIQGDDEADGGTSVPPPKKNAAEGRKNKPREKVIREEYNDAF